MPLWLLLVAMVAGPLWAALRRSLIRKAAWPADCMPSLSGKRRRSLNIFLEQLDCSPGLLAGGFVEWATFVVLWSLPIGLAALVLALYLREQRLWKASAARER